MHYDLFEVALTRNRGETYEAWFDRALSTVNAAPARYQVNKFNSDVFVRSRKLHK